MTCFFQKFRLNIFTWEISSGLFDLGYFSTFFQISVGVPSIKKSVLTHTFLIFPLPPRSLWKTLIYVKLFFDVAFLSFLFWKESFKAVFTARSRCLWSLLPAWTSNPTIKFSTCAPHPAQKLDRQRSIFTLFADPVEFYMDPDPGCFWPYLKR